MSTWTSLPPKPTSNPELTSYYAYILTVFGTPSLFFIAFVVFGIAALIVKDTAFINEHPYKFLFETLGLGIVATLPFLYVIWARTGTIALGNLVEFAVLVLHFAGLHLLFQFAGVYTLLFRGTAAPTSVVSSITSIASSIKSWL